MQRNKEDIVPIIIASILVIVLVVCFLCIGIRVS